MHILVLPSEEFVPARSPMAGIFQFQQLQALVDSGDEKFGVLSIRLRYSVPMLLKTMIFRLIGRHLSNGLEHAGVMGLFKMLVSRWFRPQTTIVEETTDLANIVCIEGLYLLPPNDWFDHLWWIRAGQSAFEYYVKLHGKPDLIHAHNSLNAGLLARQILKRYKVPYVLMEHSSYYHQNRVPRTLFPPIRSAIADASVFLVVSRGLANSMKSRLGPLAKQAVVLGNVLAPNFSDGNRHTGSKGKDLFLSVGNLLPVKGHAGLIRAFARVVKQQPSARLRIVGDGPLRLELINLARSLGVSKQIEFVGEVEHHEVRKEMLQADYFVLPSRFETFGVVLIEAMACGLPVIASKIGGPLDLVNDTNGLLVAPDDVDALAAAMQNMVSGQLEFDRNEIQSFANDNWGADSFARRLRTIYQTVLDGGNMNMASQ